MGLYFFEQLVKRCDTDKLAKDPQYKGSIPQMMTSIGMKYILAIVTCMNRIVFDEMHNSVTQLCCVVRKKELRDKVDVNFDGRVGFLEYLLYQVCSVTSACLISFC